MLRLQAMLSSEGQDVAAPLYQAVSDTVGIDLPPLDALLRADGDDLARWRDGLSGYERMVEVAVPPDDSVALPRRRPSIKLRLHKPHHYQIGSVIVINYPIVDVSYGRPVYGQVVTEVRLGVTYELTSLLPPTLPQLPRQGKRRVADLMQREPPHLVNCLAAVQVRITDHGTGSLGMMSYDITERIPIEYRWGTIVHARQRGSSFIAEFAESTRAVPGRQLGLRIPQWVDDVLRTNADDRILSEQVNAIAPQIGFTAVVQAERERKDAKERLTASLTLQASAETLTHALKLGVEPQELIRTALVLLARNKQPE